MTEALTLTVLFLLAADALIAWAWVVRYSRHPHWRATEYGRHLMRFSAVVAVALTTTLVLALVDEPPWLGLSLAGVVYLGLGVEMGNRHRLLTRADDGEGPPSV